MKKYFTTLIGATFFALFSSYAPHTLAYEYETCNGKPVKWANASNPVSMLLDRHSFTSDVWINATHEVINRLYNNPSNLYFTLTDDYSYVGLNNGESEIWFTNSLHAPAVTYVYDSCDVIHESDVVFNSNEAYTPYSNTLYLWNYGGSYRPYQTTAMHELGHAMGLEHEDDEYNVMGEDYTHIHANGGFGTAYLGEDAAHGAIALYGLYWERWNDLSVTHWKYSGTDGEYSRHMRTRMFNSSSFPLSSINSYGEPKYAVNEGGSYQVEFTFETSGADPQTVNIGYYLSSDRNITTADRWIGGRSMYLSIGTTLTTKHSVSIPFVLSHCGSFICYPGYQDYYIGVVVDTNNAVGERDEGNNSTYLPIRVY